VAAFVYETPNEKALSGALALVMHLLFAALLVFGVTWKRPEPAAMVADLWSNLPPVKTPKAAPPPPPKVEPEPPKPAPKIEPKPVPPKVEPKPQPRAEIDLREKKEKERLAQEKALAEKKKREAQALAEKKRQEQLAKEAEAKRLAQEQADALKKLAQQQAAEQARALEKYKQAVAARIRRFIVEPPSLQGNPEVEFEVIQLPGGEILGIRTRKPSSQTAWDNAVERAIQRAQPLPPPPDPAMFKDVRELHLKFRPKE
jgi:colicin import membrane protein